MSRRITATEAARTFSTLLNRVRFRGEDFVVVRGGEEVCRIGPVAPVACTVAELSRVLGGLPRLDDEYLDAVERAVKRQPRAPRSPWD